MHLVAAEMSSDPHFQDMLLTDRLFTNMTSCKIEPSSVLTLRQLMFYIYVYIYIYMEHLFLMFLDHTQRRSTVGRTPLDE